MNENVAVYICDNDYMWLTEISMISLIEKNKNILIYVIGPDITQENKERLSQLAQIYGNICTVIDLPERFSKKTNKKLRWPVFAISRLFLADILPNSVSKVLYLDSDTLIMRNLDELWEYDMRGYILCGVKDCISWRYKRNIGLKKEESYINGGVLLINLTELRKVNHLTSVRKFFSEHLYETSYYDQDALNLLFQNEIDILPPKYNVMTVVAAMSYKEIKIFRHPANYYSSDEISFARADPYIIHFTQQILFWRPWIKGSRHPYFNSFWHYADKLGIDKSVLQNSTRIQSLLSNTLLYCPGAVKYGILYILGIFHSVWLPEIRHIKNKLYLISRTSS